MCRVPIWIVMFFPCLVLVGSVAMGIMFLIQVSITDPYFTNSINFTQPIARVEHRSPFADLQILHRFCDGTKIWDTTHRPLR
ncbi:hypothetical protein OG21DRAFT_1217069 [Imleria badia]|nr:hypothetical protein OG21DRAFT_1217069 [Imleria badia]